MEDLASLEAKVVNEGAVVEMTRRRYNMEFTKSLKTPPALKEAINERKTEE